MTEKCHISTSPFPPLSPGTLRIYSNRFCPYAERARLVMTHKNIDFETVNVHLKDKPSWFWDRNPKGLVPVLEHDGKVLYESLVTCDYLEDLYPNNRLTPSDPYRKALDSLVVDHWSKVISFYYKLYKEAVDNAEVNNFLEALDKIEKVLVKRGTPYFGGNSTQLVDFVIWPHAERFGAVAEMHPAAAVTTDRFPKFTQWMKTMEGNPSVQKCRFDTPTHLHVIKSMIAGNGDYDVGL